MFDMLHDNTFNRNLSIQVKMFTFLVGRPYSLHLLCQMFLGLDVPLLPYSIKVRYIYYFLRSCDFIDTIMFVLFKNKVVS